MNPALPCPLCGEFDAGDYYVDRRRPYRYCGNCALVFVPPDYCLDREAEKAEYDLHRNEVNDPAYRRFLGRLADPLLERLSPGASGLDFGCGPGPALAVMLAEQGFEVALFDSFYHPDREALDRVYDFICATEVVEHLRHPGVELDRLWRLLRPGGWLGIMTKLVLDAEAFGRWHYKNDPTHVCFFSEITWRWWAKGRGVEPVFVGADVILLQKPRG